MSKRAFEIEDLVEQIKSIWHVYEGPMENVFRVLSYLIPFVPGLGWGVAILEKVASLFGYGMGDFGAAIDRFVGLKPESDIEERDLDDVSGFISNMLKAKAQNDEEIIKKTAWFGGVIKLITSVPKAMRLVWLAVKFLLYAFGVSKIGEIYTIVSGSKKSPGQRYLENQSKEPDTPSDSGEGSGLMSVEQAKNLMELAKDPTQLTKLFGVT